MLIGNLGRVVVAGILVGAAPVALAQSAAGFYVFGAVGSADHGLDQAKLNTTYALAIPPTTDVASISQSGTAYKLGVGFRFGSHFAVEGAYGQLGKTAYNVNRPGLIGGGNFNLGVEPKGWQLAAVGILPLTQSLELFGKLGITGLRNKGAIQNNGGFGGAGIVGDQGGLSSDTTTVMGLGLNVGVTRNVFIRGEFEKYSDYKVASAPDKRPVWGPLAQQGGDVKNDTSVISIGVGYKF